MPASMPTPFAKLPLRFWTLALLGLLIVGSTQAWAAGQTKLLVEFWGPGYDGCDSSENKYTTNVSYIVDGMYDIRVTLLPYGERPGEVEYTGISDWAWPEGLVISVGQASSKSSPLQPSATLRKGLQLEYYVTATQTMLDSLWRTRGERPPRGMCAPEYHFSFKVPVELANSYLCVSAEWNHPQYGRLAPEYPACVKIVSPCSQAALHVAWTSQVYTAREQNKHELAVALADSFIAIGWHEVRGLLEAEDAAKQLGQYNDAIRFLDICFEWNHTILPLEGWTPDSPATESGRRFYEQQRARLQELKNQQEQR